MSDEALDAHLDWLDKCAKEQGDIYDALLEKTIAQLEEENAALKREKEMLMRLLDRLYMATDDEIYEEVYLVITPPDERIER